MCALTRKLGNPDILRTQLESKLERMWKQKPTTWKAKKPKQT